MTTIQVLDKGFVRLVDSMGDDKRIVDAARVSYDNHETHEGLTERDKKLIRYLMRNRHTSPFEKVRFEFHVKAPKPIAVQWMRHRTGSFNEISGRYSVIKNEYYVPDELRTNEGVKNKQGSRVEDFPPEVRELWEDAVAAGHEDYEHLLERGVAKEMARFVMPYGFYTEFYWTVDLHNLLHFLSLRMDSHAQAEIRWYADALWELARTVAPVAVDAWYDDVFWGEHLYGDEAQALFMLLGTIDLTDFLTDDDTQALNRLFERMRNA